MIGSSARISIDHEEDAQHDGGRQQRGAGRAAVQPYALPAQSR